jgi:hypothetical protein
MYRTEASTDRSITWWFTHLKKMGSVEKKKSTEKPRTSEETEKHIRQSHVSSPKASITHHTLELGVSKTTI